MPWETALCFSLFNSNISLQLLIARNAALVHKADPDTQKSNARKLGSICSSSCCIQFPLASMLLSAWHPPCRLQAQECSSALIRFPVPISFPLRPILVLHREKRKRLSVLRHKSPALLCSLSPCELCPRRCARRSPVAPGMPWSLQIPLLTPAVQARTRSRCKGKQAPNIAALPHAQAAVLRYTDPDSPQLWQ